jgi:hypothetical protein
MQGSRDVTALSLTIMMNELVHSGASAMREIISPDDLVILSELERKVLWLASWTIHHANHLRENTNGLKVGGHQASWASLATITTALYFRILRAHDRIAVEPQFSRHHALHHTEAQAQGERGIERGHTTAGTEVPRDKVRGEPLIFRKVTKADLVHF